MNDYSFGKYIFEKRKQSGDSQNELGRKLKALRLEKGLTQENVAFEVDISRDHLSNIELGKQPVNIKTLYKLAQFFEVDMKYFF